MQGLPTQLLSKSAKAMAQVDISAKPKAEAVVDGSAETSQSKNIFSALFEGLTGSSDNRDASSEVKSKKDETLKNLLGLNAKGQNVEDQNTQDEVHVVVDSKQAEALLAALATNAEVPSQNKISETPPELNANGKNVEVNVEQKITKTSNNLDQLLNSLKGTQDNREVTEEEGYNLPQDVRPIRGQRPANAGLKTESPLDFLMNGSKTKDVTENVEIEKSSDIETLLGQKKMMTGEDYLKNMESSEKKGAAKLALINGMELPKNVNQNVKVYGQGVTLLSDPLIRNTKDLAFKDGNKGKHASVDEVRSPDMKVGAELSSIKQDVIPMIQNRENHGQQAETQTQGNQKVLDLGNINTSNTNEIIKRISDYVEQNQVANKSSLDLIVKHESLGEFKIQVSKMPSQSMSPGSNLIDMQITTSSREGQDFFVKNEVSLMRNLNNAGINLSDLRIVSSMADSSSSGQTDSRQSNSQHNTDSNSKQFAGFESGSFSSDSSNGKERRKELWEEYQQRYGA